MATTTNIESTKRHLRALEFVAPWGGGSSASCWRRADPTGSEMVTAS